MDMESACMELCIHFHFLFPSLCPVLDCERVRWDLLFLGGARPYVTVMSVRLSLKRVDRLNWNFHMHIGPKKFEFDVGPDRHWTLIDPWGSPILIFSIPSKFFWKLENCKNCEKLWKLCLENNKNFLPGNLSDFFLTIITSWTVGYYASKFTN